MADYNLKALESLLTEIRKFAVPAREPTLFALGGRGYYENPTSDLLAFFLKPDAEHGLGVLFLSAFLECMTVDHRQLDLNHIDIQREVRTQKQNRIDLQIIGSDWCLLIENKIYHWQANPFPDYENHASSLGKKSELFAILSPNGTSDAARWRGVSYNKYCHLLKEKMATVYFTSPFTKWQLFARELILHLENELYNPLMTEDQATFLEERAVEIAELKKLQSGYRGFLQQQVQMALSPILPPESLTLKDEGWAIRCYCSQWGKSNLALWREDGNNFMVTAYLTGLTEEQRTEASTFFRGMKHWIADPWLCWYLLSGFETRAMAIEAVAKYSQFLTKLFRTPPAPIQTPTEMLPVSD